MAEEILKQDSVCGDGIFVSPNYVMLYGKKDKIYEVSHSNTDECVILEVLDNCYDSWIKIYADRMRGWFIQHAKELNKERNAGFVVLMVCAAYLESSEQFLTGKQAPKGESSQFIRNSLIRVAKIGNLENPLVKKAINMFVSHVRNGLFHDCMTGKNISLSSKYSAILGISEGENPILQVNPSLFLSAIEEDLEGYVKRLNDKEDNDYEKLSENFQIKWKLSWIQ